MDGPLTKRRKIIRFDAGKSLITTDEVALEYALTVYVNDEELATLVCSPEFLEQLTVGFLASEGVIRSAADIRELAIDAEKGFAYVKTVHPVAWNQQFYNKRYIASCCGKSRQSFYFFNDARTVKHVDPANGAAILAIPDVFRLMGEMEAASTAFQNTGGVHNAALCTREAVLLTRTDIGRHNALDKIYGYCLQRQLPTADKIIAFSGRISSEVLLKVAKIGASVVLSKSAPTELALDLAEELGITAIGFIRGEKLNVYTHPERLAEYVVQSEEAAPSSE